MTDLARLLADCDADGIRLFAASNGGLAIDAPKDALTPDRIRRLKAHKAELLALLRPPVNPSTAPVEKEEDASVTSAKPLCRCGSAIWRDVPIHNGQSIRRDCGRCGRFLDFPVWHGNYTGHNGQHPI